MMNFAPAFMVALTHGLSFTIVRICRIRARINLELYFVIVILGAAMALATASYLPAIGSAKIVGAMTSASYTDARMDAIIYHAHNGVWPRDNASALSAGWRQNYIDDDSRFVEETTIDQGAFNLHLSEDFAEKVLTVRPALPSGDSATVIWVCGNRRPADAWTLIGKDQTTVDELYINRHLW